MKLILLQDVEKLGLRGDVVDVARGYGRNFLLPRRLAEDATPARVAELERVEAARATHEARSEEQAQEIAELLGKTVLRFEVKAGPTGSLFGSVTPSDVADEIWRTRKVRVDRRKIAADPLKRIGRDRFIRNVAYALGNSAAPESVPAIQQLLNDKSPLVRDAARWAFSRLTGGTHETRPDNPAGAGL